MSGVVPERVTQTRVIKRLVDDLDWTYLGDWQRRAHNSNLEHSELVEFLEGVQGYDPALVRRAIEMLRRASDGQGSLYDRNKAVYSLLRYGVKVKAGVGDQHETLWLIDWERPARNRFGVAEEVTVQPKKPDAHVKRPDLVFYVNGIALGILELKKGSQALEKGVRQNRDSQRPEYIEHFFSTMQLVMAGNEAQGLRYGTIGTEERYYLEWKEPSEELNLLDRAVLHLLEKGRFLELIHHFVVFDAGTKKLCRHNQYFGVRAAQARILAEPRESGIIWHTQGSGKSLTMVWLAKWIREHVKHARVLIVTDRTELDEQIEAVFGGVSEKIYRTKSGADLVATLMDDAQWLMCSLIHKFGGRSNNELMERDVEQWLAEVKAALPVGFAPAGDLFVFVDECHRTQSGGLNRAMRAMLPDAMFIGFTGTPLLKKDKQSSLEVFGPYIHRYRFDEAVQDGVILDLRYEARDIEQVVKSQAKIDAWFEARTRDLTPLARAQLKARWGTMRSVLSSRERLNQIVHDILMDMMLKPRLSHGHGNALLVSGSIYQACRYYELFSKTPLKGKCAVVTSYSPSHRDVKGEDSGEGTTEKLLQYEVYQQMLADFFDAPKKSVLGRAAEFERDVKERFVKQPGQMKLLIVVDKLLTGFDAPSATYLYIDKSMQDHGLFQAICRVNRLDGETKRYGYVVDYKDLFRSLEAAVRDYTQGGFEGFDRADVEGLVKDRLDMARADLDEALERVRALCEPVEPPKDQTAFQRYFSWRDEQSAVELKASEARRLAFYKHVASLSRAFADIAGELIEAGYSADEAQDIRAEVKRYVELRDAIKLHSGDKIDLKRYEPDMRYLIDTFIGAEDSQKVSDLDDMTLIETLVARGVTGVEALPDRIKDDPTSLAETIENNVRRLILDETPVNPKYYESLSTLLDALVEQRRKDAIAYKAYLEAVVDLTRKAKVGPRGDDYPTALDSPAKRALYDNLGQDEALALAVDRAVRAKAQHGWRDQKQKRRRVLNAIVAQVGDSVDAEAVLRLVEEQGEY